MVSQLERFVPANEPTPEGWRIDRWTWCGRNSANSQWYEITAEGAARLTMRAKVVVPTKQTMRRIRRGDGASGSALVEATKRALRSTSF